MACSPPGPSVCGICQARILEWVAISFSRGSFLFRDQIRVSCLTGRFFITKPPGKPILLYICVYIHICVYVCVYTFIRCLENYNWFVSQNLQKDCYNISGNSFYWSVTATKLLYVNQLQSRNDIQGTCIFHTSEGFCWSKLNRADLCWISYSFMWSGQLIHMFLCWLCTMWLHPFSGTRAWAWPTPWAWSFHGNGRNKRVKVR